MPSIKNNMANDNLTKFWTDKWTNELNEWGVTVPEGISHDELKKLHMGSKPKSKPAKNPVDMTSVPADQIAALVEKLVNERLADALKEVKPSVAASNGPITAEAIKEIFKQAKSEEINEDGLVPEGYVPPEDYIPTQKFFAPFARYYVMGKEVGPVVERLPYNLKMLRFEPKFAYYIKQNGIQHHKHISILEVSSRKLYEYITGETLDGKKVGTPLPEYGRVIFKDAGSAAATEQTEFAQMVMKHFNAYAKRPLHELVTEHQKNGMPTTSSWSISDYAWSLASRRAEKEMDQLHEEYSATLRRREAGRALLRNEGVSV